MPMAPVGLHQTDRRLAAGHRRTGEFIYETRCPSCQACQPVRLICPEYVFSKNAKRVLSKNNNHYRQEFGPSRCDQQRLDLFNKHRLNRGLATEEADIDQEGYEWGFVRTCMTSFEISYWDDQRLVAVAICDRGLNSLSAVYTFYDPDDAKNSVGTYSILKQIQYCRENELQHLYLGYYIAQSPHMRYKSRFTPQERLVHGRWSRFEK